MGRKKIVPKKIGSVKIPKNLRRIGDKALADPKVAGIVSGALTSAAALVGGREVVQDVAGGTSATKALARSEAVSGLPDLVRRAFEEIMEARHRDARVPAKGGKAKRSRHDDEARRAGPDRDEETRAEEADRLH